MAEEQIDLSFLDCEGVKHTVNGKELTFHPASLETMFRLRGLAQKIGTAFAVLTADTNSDNKLTKKRTLDKGADSELDQSETVHDAVTPEMATMRLRERSKAVDDIIGSLLDEKNMEAMGLLIMESLPDKFPISKRLPPAEFRTRFKLPVLSQMIVGVAKANKGMFGPLTDRLGGMMTAIEKMIAEKVAPAVAGSETAGSDSKIKSSGVSNEGTNSAGS